MVFLPTFRKTTCINSHPIIKFDKYQGVKEFHLLAPLALYATVCSMTLYAVISPMVLYNLLCPGMPLYTHFTPYTPVVMYTPVCLCMSGVTANQNWGAYNHRCLKGHTGPSCLPLYTLWPSMPSYTHLVLYTTIFQNFNVSTCLSDAKIYLSDGKSIYYRKAGKC